MGTYDLTKAESRWRKGKEKSPEHSHCYRSGRRGRTSKRLKRSDQGDRRKTKRGLSWKPNKGGGYCDERQVTHVQGLVELDTR